MSWNASLVCGPIASDDGAYLINIAPEMARPGIEAFRIHPETPDVVWAGDEPVWATVFLRFADEAEARGVLPELWVGEAG